MVGKNISPSINLTELCGQEITGARGSGVPPATNLKVCFRILLLGLLYVLPPLLSTSAVAAPINVLYERDSDGQAGSELAVVTYPDLASLIGNTTSFTQFTQIDVSAAFSVGGITYDGSAYRVLYERDSDGQAGNELAVVSYPDLASLIGNTNTITQFTQIDVSAAFSVGGFYTEFLQDHSSQPVSEPATLSLFAFGLVAMGLTSRWRRKSVKSFPPA